MGNFYPELSDSDYLSEYGAYTRAMRAVLEQPWQDLPLESGWADYSGGGGYNGGFKARIIGNRVEINAMVRDGSGKITDLPGDMLPESSIMLPVVTSGGYGAISVTNGGSVNYIQGPSSPAYVTIQVSFPIDNDDTP